MIRELLKIPHAIAIMEILYDEGEINIGELAARLKKNYYLIKKSLKKLEEMGIIQEEQKGKGTVLSLTSKGAELYKQIDRADAIMTSDWKERFKNMRAMVHYNEYENVIRIGDYLPDGTARYVDVEINIRGNKIYLYCNACKSFNCEHINFIWAHPKLRRDLLSKAQEKHLIIVEPEDAEKENGN